MRWVGVGVIAAAWWGVALANESSPPALVGGKPITTSELDARFSDQSAQRERNYAAQVQRLRLQFEREKDAARRALLETIIDERLLELEATARGVTVEALRGSVVVDPVSQDDLMAAAARARSTQGGDADPELLGRVQAQLEQQARDRAMRSFLQELGGKYEVRMQLEPRREAVSVDDSPVRGPNNAKVTIVEFADFQCPYCLRVESTLQHVLADHPQDVRLVFKQLPIQELHPDAMRLARGAVCAHRQHKFWEFHDTVFAHRGRIDQAQMLGIAGEAGVDTGALETCVSGTDPDREVARDVDAANALLIGGTPALFINGRMIQGAPSYEMLSSIVAQELLAHPR